MDDFEKRVLRLKKPTFAEHVDITIDFLNSIKRANLINEDMLQVIKTEYQGPLRSEKNENARASLFIDYIMSSQINNAFDVFMSVLMTDYSWLAKELQADLKAERGNLTIDDDVLKESGMLVHRKFGTSKRISEMDKRDMQDLIAVKIQISKEEWKEEIDTLKSEIKRLDAYIESEEKKARQVDAFLWNFIEANESKLVSRALGSKSTSDILRDTVSDTDAIGILYSHLKMVTSRARIVIEERDLLFDEREKCYSVCGFKESESSVPLHEMLKNQRDALPGKLKKVQADLEEKEGVIKRLRKLLAEYEKELEGNDDKVKDLRDESELKATENQELKRMISKLQQENEELRVRLEAKETSVKKNRKMSTGK